MPGRSDKEKRIARRLVVAGLLLFVCVVGLIAYSYGSYLEAAKWISHTQDVESALNDLLSSNAGIEARERNFVVTGNPAFLEDYANVRARSKARVQALRELLADNPQELERLSEADKRVRDLEREIGEIIALRQKGDVEAALERVDKGPSDQMTDAVRSVVIVMREEEARLFRMRSATANARSGLTALTGALASVFFGVIAASWWALRARAEMQEQFIAILGHDLRNPLNAITMGASSLTGAPPERVAVIAGRIERSAERMQRMIAQLLDLTRIRSGGGIQIVPARVDLATVANEMLDELRKEEGSARVHVEASGDTNGSWDRDRVAQILSNLVANALTHGAADKPISVVIDGNSPDHVTVAVKNDGEPIPEQVRRAMFQPFRRGARANPKSDGLGLGLFIANELVRAHEGSLGFTSTREEGTVFTATLPRRPARKGKPSVAVGAPTQSPH